MLSLVTKTKNIIFGVVVRLKRFNDIIEIALKYNEMGKESECVRDRTRLELKRI